MWEEEEQQQLVQVGDERSTVVNVSEMSIVKDNVQDILRLRRMLDGSPRVFTLSPICDPVRLSSSIRALARNLKKSKNNLKVIDLSQCEVNDNDILNIADALRHPNNSIQSSLVTDRGLMAIANASASTCLKLEDLRLHGTSVTSTGIRALTRVVGLSSLRRIVLTTMIESDIEENDFLELQRILCLKRSQWFAKVIALCSLRTIPRLGSTPAAKIPGELIRILAASLPLDLNHWESSSPPTLECVY